MREAVNNTFYDAVRESFRLKYGPRPPLSFVRRLEDELFAIEAADKGTFAEDLSFAARLREAARREGCEASLFPGWGAGLVPWLCGASDVDPLPPHYLCSRCGRTELVPGAKDGWDLPEKRCCGVPMRRGGHAIPLASFLVKLKAGPAGPVFWMPKAFAPTALAVAEAFWGASGRCRLVPLAPEESEEEREAQTVYALLSETERGPGPDRDGFRRADRNGPRQAGRRLLTFRYGETKQMLRDAYLGTGRAPTPEELLSEANRKAAQTQILARLREDGRPLLSAGGSAFSQLLALHGYERSAYPDTNPVFSLPGASCSEVFTCREEVLERVLREDCPRQSPGIGLAAAIAERTRRGRFTVRPMDEETKRVLREAGLSEHWITQIEQTRYLPPKADVIQTLTDELKRCWYASRQD